MLEMVRRRFSLAVLGSGYFSLHSWNAGRIAGCMKQCQAGSLLMLLVFVCYQPTGIVSKNLSYCRDSSRWGCWSLQLNSVLLKPSLQSTSIKFTYALLIYAAHEY